MTSTPTTAAHPQRKHRRLCERRQKLGKRGGIWTTLAANSHKPAIPSIVLPNVCSLDSKLDNIHLLRSTQQTELCCVSVFTETWLNNSIPDSAIQLDRLTCYRADRALTEGGKTRGGGVCVYIRDALVSGRCGGLQTLFTPCRVYDHQVPAFLFTEGVF